MTEIEWLDIFGDNLKCIIAEVGITQRELADEMRVNESAVSKYIHKQCIPSLKAVLKMSYILNCDISELIDFGEPIE